MAIVFPWIIVPVCYLSTVFPLKEFIAFNLPELETKPLWNLMPREKSFRWLMFPVESNFSRLLSNIAKQAVNSLPTYWQRCVGYVRKGAKVSL